MLKLETTLLQLVATRKNHAKALAVHLHCSFRNFECRDRRFLSLGLQLIITACGKSRYGRLQNLAFGTHQQSPSLGGCNWPSIGLLLTFVFLACCCYCIAYQRIDSSES